MNATTQTAKLPTPLDLEHTAMLTTLMKSVLDVTIEGYKQLGLMHGGAIIVMMTFVGHSGSAKYPLVLLLIGIGLFATGLWANLESMAKARQVQVAMFNRQWLMLFIDSAVRQLQLEHAQQQMPAIHREDQVHVTALRTAMRLFRLSLACFIIGAAWAIGIVVLFG